MSRKPINWAVEELDVKEFIKPVNIEVPIDKGQYIYISNDNMVKNKTLNTYLLNLEKAMVNSLYDENIYDKYKRLLYSKLSLSYIPDFKNNNWYIGYSPIKFFNDIFETLNINEKIDYFDYSDKEKVNRIKNRIMLTLNEEQLKLTKEDVKNHKYEFIGKSIDAIDKIFLLSDYDIESKIKDSIKYKNLLYYLSVKSLDILDETDDINYAVIPRQYYTEVSTKNTAKWPNQLYMDNNRVYSYNYYNFNDRFNEVLLRYPCIFEEELGIDKISVMDKIEIVRADNFIDDVEDAYDYYTEIIKKKKKYTKTDQELNEMLNDKIKFYRDLMNLKDVNDNNVVISPIKGKNDLYGYYGFILNNNYIVLDKFFNIRKTDNKVKPSADEAIYSMPLDLFVELNGSKKKMMEYIKNNPKGNVKRNYHTKKHSYKEKILKICKKEDVSTMKNDWFLSIYSPKELTLNNKSVNHLN